MGHSRVLLAGASGAVGFEVLRLLKEGGHFIRTLSRSEDNANRLRPLANQVILADATRKGALAGMLEGMDVVVSCLGANVSLGMRERRGFGAVDLVAHWNILEEARRASSVKRFVYLSAHTGPGFDETRYIRAHRATEEAIQTSGLTYSFVQPTGIFTALGDLITMARMGFGSVAGSGKAKANPVHPLDVAEAIVEALEDGPAEIPVGGPEIMTREEIMRLAFEVVGKKPRIVHVPPGVFRFWSFVLRPVHPRMSDMLEFVAAVMTSDSMAPARGKRTLRPWFEELAKRPR
jgi:uncharacterized protein YbjT (DUF2867 family)